MEPRYNPSDFEAFIENTANEPRKSASISVAVDEFVLDPNANPPTEKLFALIRFDKDFQAAWERKKPMPNDSTGSGYDQSLATITALLGWPDQEIINLLIANRRFHGDLEKHGPLHSRVSYYKNTLSKAKAKKVEKEEEAAAVEETALREMTFQVELDAVQPNGDGSLDEEAKIKRWASFEKYHSVDYEKLQCFKSKDGTEGDYVFVLRRGMKIHMGGVRSIRSQDIFLDKMTDALAGHHTIRRVKREIWEKRANQMIQLREEVDRGYEGEGGVELLDWLSRYLAHHNPIPLALNIGPRSALIMKSPGIFADADDNVYFVMSKFQNHLKLEYGREYTPRELGRLLTMIGAKGKIVGYYSKQPPRQTTTPTVKAKRVESAETEGQTTASYRVIPARLVNVELQTDEYESFKKKP